MTQRPRHRTIQSHHVQIRPARLPPPLFACAADALSRLLRQACPPRYQPSSKRTRNGRPKCSLRACCRRSGAGFICRWEWAGANAANIPAHQGAQLAMLRQRASQSRQIQGGDYTAPLRITSACGASLAAARWAIPASSSVERRGLAQCANARADSAEPPRQHRLPYSDEMCADAAGS
jgi:hypothetical protein